MGAMGTGRWTALCLLLGWTVMTASTGCPDGDDDAVDDDAVDDDAGDDDTGDDDGPASCGDGIVEDGEECDGSDLAGATCASLGYDLGELTCAADCTLDAAQCIDCGDGKGSMADDFIADWLSDGWEETLVEGTGWRRSRAIWAILADVDGEGLAQTHEETLRSILRGWTGNDCPGIGELVDDDPWYWGFYLNQGNMAEIGFLARILLQFPDQLPPDVLSCLDTVIPGAISMGSGNPNTEVGRWAALFLTAQEDRSVTMTCPTSMFWDDGFTWDQRSYVVGQTYPRYDLSRDAWLMMLDDWARDWEALGGENDSEHYTWLFLGALMLLVDFADRPLAALGGQEDPEGVEIQRRAEMVLDLLLLDNVLDYSADQHGGFLGRHYFDTLVDGYQMNFFDLYWGMHATASRRFPAVSRYRLPYVVEDLGRLDDEGPGYWHVNRENRDHGKWTWVAEDYNLGGSTNGEMGYMDQWLLALRSSNPDEPAPLLLFINTDETYHVVDNEGYGSDRGTWGYLWRYAGLVRSWGFIDQYLHILLPDGDLDEIRGLDPPEDPYGPWDVRHEWAFLREGDVVVAIGRQASWLMSIEVAELGVDYGGTVYTSLDDFEAAVEANAVLGVDGDYDMYVTSRGDTIAIDADPTTTEYKWTLVMPAGDTDYALFDETWPVTERIVAEDRDGVPLVSWSGRQMTVQRHGCARHYDFDAWTTWDEFSPECPICQPVGGGEAASPPAGEGTASRSPR